MERKYIPNSILRQICFLIVTALMFFLVIYHLAVFIPGVLGALCLYVLLIKPLRFMMFKWKLNRVLSVIGLMLGSVLVIATPLVYLINILTSRVSEFLDNKVEIQRQIEAALAEVQHATGIDILHEVNLSDVTSIGIKVIQEILNTSVNGVMQLGVAYLFLFFMLMNFRKMENWFYNNIPLKTENLVILGKDLRDLIISNAVGVPVVAFLQAVVAYIGYLIFGLDGAFTWFMLTVFGAMLPVVGSAAVYIPAVIYMLAQGETTNAYLLLAYCILIVGTSDNVFRLLTQKVMADVHPLITIFGVVLGLNLFGFIGIIFGPIFLSMVFWMLRIYKLEFTNVEPDKVSNQVVDPKEKL